MRPTVVRECVHVISEMEMHMRLISAKKYSTVSGRANFVRWKLEINFSFECHDRTGFAAA